MSLTALKMEVQCRSCKNIEYGNMNAMQVVDIHLAEWIVPRSDVPGMTQSMTEGKLGKANDLNRSFLVNYPLKHVKSNLKCR